MNGVLFHTRIRLMVRDSLFVIWDLFLWRWFLNLNCRILIFRSWQFYLLNSFERLFFLNWSIFFWNSQFLLGRNFDILGSFQYFDFFGCFDLSLWNFGLFLNNIYFLEVWRLELVIMPGKHRVCLQRAFLNRLLRNFHLWILRIFSQRLLLLNIFLTF